VAFDEGFGVQASAHIVGIDDVGRLEPLELGGTQFIKANGGSVGRVLFEKPLFSARVSLGKNMRREVSI
jgi:hypothetical protein